MIQIIANVIRIPNGNPQKSIPETNNKAQFQQIDYLF